MNESNVPQIPHISRSDSFVRSSRRDRGGDSDHDNKTRIVSDLKMTPREWYDPGSLLLLLYIPIPTTQGSSSIAAATRAVHGWLYSIHGVYVT